MATEKQLIEALKRADEAGNTQDAQLIADSIKQMRSSNTKKKAGPLKQAEAAVRGVTTGLLGVGDHAAAAGDVIGGQVIRPLIGKERLPIEDTYKRVRADRKQLEQDAPLASGAGMLAGALAPVSRFGGVAQKLGLGLKKGAPVGNTLRTAAQGAVEGAVTEANMGGDLGEVVQAGGISGLASPFVGAAIRTGGAVVDAGRSLIDRKSDAGFRTLARALSREGVNVSPKALRERADDFKAQLGRPPTVTELVGESGGRDILETVQSGNRAQEHLLDAAERQVTELQENLAGNIGGNKVRTSKPALLERRGSSMDAFMQKKDRFGKQGQNMGEKPIRLGQEDIEMLLDPDISIALPRQAKRLLYDLQDSATGDGDISLRDLDNIRQAFAKAGKGTGEAVRFKELSDIIKEVGIEDVPEYGRALGEFRRRSEAADGLVQGQGIREADATEFAQALRPRTAEAPNRASTSQRAGVRIGARQELAETARQSPRDAASLAESLAKDAGLQNKLQAIDPTEAARLAGIGEGESEALKSVASTVNGARIRSAAQEEADGAKATVEALILASGRASGGFQANFASRLANRYKVPPTAALKLAEAVTDPKQTDEVIERLIKYGIEPSQIESLARAAARATSRTTGPTATEEQ